MKKLGITLLIIIVILAAAGLILFHVAKSKAQDYVLETAMKQYISALAISDEVTDEQVEQAIASVQEKLTEEDKAVVEEIIENHISAETVQEIAGYIKNQDISGLEGYAEGILTEEELEQVRALCSTYGDELLKELENERETAQEGV